MVCRFSLHIFVCADMGQYRYALHVGRSALCCMSKACIVCSRSFFEMGCGSDCFSCICLSYPCSYAGYGLGCHQLSYSAPTAFAMESGFGILFSEHDAPFLSFSIGRPYVACLSTRTRLSIGDAAQPAGWHIDLYPIAANHFEAGPRAFALRMAGLITGLCYRDGN